MLRGDCKPLRRLGIQLAEVTAGYTIRGMSGEALQSLPTVEDEASGAPKSTTGSSLALLAILTALCWLGAFLLPSQPPMYAPDTLGNWVNFVLRCLCDICWAAGILGLCLGLAIAFPSLGLFLERVVLRSSRRSFLAVTIGFSVLTSAVFAYVVMDHVTHIVDETAMLFQAQVLASGRLYADCPPVPEAFDYEFLIADPQTNKWYGKYFIGQSLFLVPGVWLGCPWLMHPIVIGICVWLVYLLGCELLNEKSARIAAVLMMFSPLRLYTGGTMMGHASSLLMMTVFALATVKVVKQPRRWGWAFIAGFFLGLSFNARPLTAVAMGAAIGLASMICFPWRQLNWRAVFAFTVGFALWVGVFFAYNRALTGDAMKSPFNQWSKNDRLGFGPEVGLEYWRDADKGHSLRRGLLIDSYYNIDALGPSLTGWGRVTLLFMLMPLVVSRWRGRSWTLFVVWLALAGIHVFHISSGVLMGQPRYWSEAAPMLFLLVAVSLAVLRQYVPRFCRSVGLVPAVRIGRSGLWTTGGVLVLLSFYLGTYPLVDMCYGFTFGHPKTFRSMAAEASLDNALVFVRSGLYRDPEHGEMDRYLGAFVSNTPDLSGPVIYARDLGPEKNAVVARHFAGRRLYWIDSTLGNNMEIIPLERAQTLPSP